MVASGDHSAESNPWIEPVVTSRSPVPSIWMIAEPDDRLGALHECDRSTVGRQGRAPVRLWTRSDLALDRTVDRGDEDLIHLADGPGIDDEPAVRRPGDRAGAMDVRVDDDRVAPSASATITSPHSCQFGMEFDSGRRLNAILVPSRENVGKPSIRGSSVSWTRPEPSGLAVQRSPSATNATEPGAASPKGGGSRRCEADDRDRQATTAARRDDEQDRNQPLRRLKSCRELYGKPPLGKPPDRERPADATSGRERRRARRRRCRRGRARRTSRPSVGRRLRRIGAVAAHALPPSPTGPIRASASSAARIACIARCKP